MTYIEKGYRRKLSLGQGGNTVVTLIAINLVIFIIFQFIKVVYRFQFDTSEAAVAAYRRDILYWFTLPADTGKMLTRPWTILTHMFVHDDIWHVFGNMLWLWVFGSIMQDLTGNRKIIPVYIYGALCGALAYVLAFNLLPGFKPLLPGATALGASAGLMAIAVATTVVAPGYRIFPMLRGGIPLWVITSLYLIIDLAFIPYSNPGGRIAHLAGAFMGFLFIFFMRRGYDWSEWMNNLFDWFNNLFNPDKPKKGKDIRQELFYKTGTMPFHKTPNITQQRIDDILDKINQKGFETLTDEEKELLKRASKDLDA